MIYAPTQGLLRDNVYFNNPVDYLSNMNEDNHHLQLLPGGRDLYSDGSGKVGSPGTKPSFVGDFNRKDIPHTLDMWGYDVDHDWPCGARCSTITSVRSFDRRKVSIADADFGLRIRKHELVFQSESEIAFRNSSSGFVCALLALFFWGSTSRGRVAVVGGGSESVRGAAVSWGGAAAGVLLLLPEDVAGSLSARAAGGNVTCSSFGSVMAEEGVSPLLSRITLARAATSCISSSDISRLRCFCSSFISSGIEGGFSKFSFGLSFRKSFMKSTKKGSAPCPPSCRFQAASFCPDNPSRLPSHSRRVAHKPHVRVIVDRAGFAASGTPRAFPPSRASLYDAAPSCQPSSAQRTRSSPVGLSPTLRAHCRRDQALAGRGAARRARLCWEMPNIRYHLFKGTSVAPSDDGRYGAIGT